MLPRLSESRPYMRAVRLEAGVPSSGDRLARAMPPRAFNFGLATVGGPEQFDVIAKIDGDIELPPEFVERCVGALGDNPGIGIVGCRLIEQIGGNTRTIPIPDLHVHGATKVYRRECLEAIGGVREQVGWDAIDETYARMAGYTTHSLHDLEANHLRPTGGAQGIVRGRARHGAAAYMTHYPLYWVLGRAVKVGFARPRIVSGLAFLAGYLHARALRKPRVDDPAFRRFARREMRSRAAGYLRGSPRAAGRLLTTRRRRAEGTR